MTKPKAKPISPARRMRAYRERLRAAGLKPVTLWLPDTKSPAFRRTAQKQSLAIAAHDPAGHDMDAFIQSVYEWPDP